MKTMKKTYKTPQTDVVHIEQYQHLLSGSLEIVNQDATVDGEFYSDAPFLGQSNELPNILFDL